ncbi:MAG: GIY-YIG nuclease family protein [Patescibacteria group bacterium]
MNKTTQSNVSGKSDFPSDVLSGYFTYVLFSQKDRKFYVGFTHDLKQRLKEHHSGNVESTRPRRPLLLIHYEYFTNEDDAKAREIFLKSGFGRKQLRLSLRKTLANLN